MRMNKDISVTRCCANHGQYTSEYDLRAQCNTSAGKKIYWARQEAFLLDDFGHPGYHLVQMVDVAAAKGPAEAAPVLHDATDH